MDETNMSPVSAQGRPKHRLSRGWVIFLVVLAVLVAVFCPKKLSWVCSLDRVTGYSYTFDNDEWQQQHGRPVEDGLVIESQAGPDLEALRRKMEDTWVVWTGWTNSIPAADVMRVFLVDDRCDDRRYYVANLCAAESEISPGMSILSPYLDNEHTIYKSSSNIIANVASLSRYVSLGGTLLDLIPT